MGLCKCPKRHVTNQFCYEHRVNVCESCMLKSHPKCIIQSYIQWLKDSDYNSSCTLCNDLLENGDCIRLICYHIFHWKCLNERQSRLPLNTAPGGHICPTCKDNIFPTSNLVSPVADVLRNKLAQVNWGRNELSLPLFAEESSNFATEAGAGNSTQDQIHPALDSPVEYNSQQQYQMIKIDNSQSSQSTNSRRPLLIRETPIGSSDRDDNKYKQKSPLEYIRMTRLYHRLMMSSSRPPWRRTWFLITAFICLFIMLIYVMHKLGRSGYDDDQVDFSHQ